MKFKTHTIATPPWNENRVLQLSNQVIIFERVIEEKLFPRFAIKLQNQPLCLSFLLLLLFVFT